MQLLNICTVLIICLGLFLFVETNAKRTVFLENNTPFDLKFDVIQSGDPFNPSNWGFHKENIRSGFRQSFFWFPKKEGFENGKKYRFVASCSSTLGDVQVLFSFDGTTSTPVLQYQIKSGDTLSPLSTFAEKYNEHKFGPFTVLARIPKADEIEFVFHHNTVVKPAPGLNVLAYNVYMRTPKSFFHNGQIIRGGLLHTVTKEYDIVIFSEAFDKETKTIMVDGLKRNGYTFFTPTVGKAGIITIDGGVFIASKHAILSHKQITFGSVCKGSDCLADKGCMYAKIRWNNQLIHVFGTHLQAHDEPAIRRVRAKQLELIRSFIDRENIPKNETILIGGDLNVDMAKAGRAEYLDMLKILRVKEPKYQGLQWTVDNTINRLANVGKEYLDYVLVEQDHKLPIESKSFHNAMIFKTIYPWKQYAFERDFWDLSDHFPVYHHLEFEN